MTTQNKWGIEHKSIARVIEELQTFKDKELIVMISDDGGETLKPIKLLGKEFDKNNQAYCTLFI